MSPDSRLTREVILESINDGVYATDRERKIIYWSRSAERITGWKADDILGRRCSDDVLCHEDKDGRRLCGEDYCPLYRCMVTGQSSRLPIIVFALSKAGDRIPMNVSVAPIRSSAGEVIGGVETFRDLTPEFSDIQRVGKIQSLSIRKRLPEDARIRFSSHYIPQDIIGGDYYAVARLDEDRFGFLMADVTGHGMSAALYTMYLGSLWESHRALLSRPREFARRVNEGLYTLFEGEGSFAAGVCGVFDLKEKLVRFVGAGNPPGLLLRGGRCERLDCSGIPLGCFDGASYDERVAGVGSGDCVLFFTDGATEIPHGNGEFLGVEGLVSILEKTGYPRSATGLEAIEKELLAYSNRIRFDDDLTFLEARLL